MSVSRCLLFATLLLVAPFSSATQYEANPEDYCLLGCQVAFSLSTFGGSPTSLDDYYLYTCTNEVYVSSLYACGRKFCSPWQHGISYLDDSCQTYGGISILDPGIVSNLTDADIQQLPIVGLDDTAIINITSVPSQELYDLGYRTIATWSDVRASHLMYSKAMFIFWGIVLAAGALHNLLYWYTPTALSKPFAKAWAKIEGALVISPTFTYHCDVPVGKSFTLPPRLESIIIFVFIALNVILCAVSYYPWAGNLYWADPVVQLLRYLADRTGYLSYANLSIFWLFGIRNNVLLWITGWEFATFNRFHRWVARVSTLEAILHSIFYTVYAFYEGGYEEYAESWLEEYWYTGVIATITMSLILGFSVMWLRTRWYETFLLLHIALALITLVNLFYHTKIFIGEYEPFLWPCVAFWAFDRAVRLGRLAFNFFTARTTVSIVEYDAAADLVRIDITSSLGRLNKAHFGTHIFVYLVKSMRFWESHPFTLVRWRADLAEGLDDPIQQDKKLTTVTSAPVSDQAASGYRYSLMVRPQGGFTSRLSRRAILSQVPTPRTLLLEGPYGEPVRSRNGTSDVLFVIGGSGISVAISAIYALLESPSPPHIHLVWAMRNAGLLTSVCSRELAAAKGRIDVDAYVTQTDPAKTEHELANIADASSENFPRPPVSYHRPDSRVCITKAVRAAKGRLAVVACGPGAMMNDVRVAVVYELRRGNIGVQLFLENFTW